MVIIPNSTIILLKSPLKLDNYNQITFSNLTAQYNYFNSLPKLTLEDATYQRKEGVIRFPTHTDLNDGLPVYEDLLKYNYCMYQNTSYSNKWFYAFIDEINYINDGVSEIKIETDTFQSWQFDIVYMNSFIEREHVSNDTIGLHTLPEGLETGEYIINSSDLITHLFDKDACYICAGISFIPDNSLGINNDRYYGDIYSGLTLIIFDDWSMASKYFTAYDKMGKGDAIINLYMLPSALVTNPTWQTATYDGVSIRFAVLPSSPSSTTLIDNISLTMNNTLNGYTPKNNKLFVWPYNYLSITNNSGTQVQFHYEDFVNNTPLFKLEALETCGVPSMLIPKNYKLKSDVSGTDIFYNYGITGGKFPMCSWQTDGYTNWLTQNGINIGGIKLDAVQTGILGSALGGIGSALGGKSATGSFGGMFNSIREGLKHSFESPTVNGQTSVGDLNFAHNGLVFNYYKMSVRREYAKIIDDFFSMYGYKVNSLKTPNIHKRSNWDYIKTIDVNLEGEIPEKDLDKIRNLFNNGCTFWHTTTYFLDYSKTNSILT